ncbi:ABC transporter substrate-binding protein [Brachybacterium sp. AOP43-C2-M15]|uniref:ABC transporter substrate-binding protein n=1 Tax=Brachybacterium sp. AOP43-C2-M15 TaxID=3457661 RepID=UPI00403488FA
MTISRRTLVHGLGAGVLGAGALAGCGEGGMRGRRGRRRATTTAPTAEALSEPDVPLVIGQIGANYGRMASFEGVIAIAIDEARLDVNARWGGLFGHPVEVLERHVMQEPGEDLTDAISAMAEAGATCVITSIDEESLIDAMPALVEAGLAVIDLLTTGMTVRATEVQTANLLIRLSPNDRILAAEYAEIALGSSSDKAGDRGTVAYLSEDTAQGRSLLHELKQVLDPRSGRVVDEQFYAVGEFGAVDERVDAVLKAEPALLVFNGGAEAAPFLSALYQETLDEGQRPTIEIPARLSPAATVDYAQLPVAEDLVPDCLTSATGMVPGTEMTSEQENLLLTRDRELLETGFGYGQHGYDAVTMACLAAQHALAVEGTALAAALPAILTGSEKCGDYDACRQVLRTALEADSRATIAYSGWLGQLELGPQSDMRTGEMREYSWNEANALEAGTAKGFEAPE